MEAGGKRCPACGGALSDWRSVPSSEPALGTIRFELLRCERCGSAVTIGAAPVRLHDSGAYASGQPRLYPLAAPLLGLADRQRLALLRRVAGPPGRLLDAGAGRGRFVLAAQHAGYDAVGIEPSRRGAQAAAAIGARVQRATIAQACVEPSSLDAVTLWHVLEHLDRPDEALERIAGWLRPGGALLVGVPNLRSLQARIGGARWYHLDVPRHRVHLTPVGMNELLRRHGFVVDFTNHLLLEHNPFGMWQSLLNLVTRHPSYLYNLLKRNAPLFSADLPITVAGLALTPVAAAFELLAGLARAGGTVAVLAHRWP